MRIAWPIFNLVGISGISFLCVRQVTTVTVQQPIFIDDPETGTSLLFRKAIVNHRKAKVVCYADRSRSSSDKNDLMISHAFSGYLGCTRYSSQDHSCGSLNVVVEGQKLVLIALQQWAGMRSRKVFPLQTGLGQLLFYRVNKPIHEIEILVAHDSLVTPTEVFRVVQSFLVVGPDIQDNRQSSRGTNPADQGIKRQLPDRNS